MPEKEVDLYHCHFALAKSAYNGLEDADLVSRLKQRPEIRLVRKLSSGCFHVEFRQGTDWEALRKFQTAVAGFAQINENYSGELIDAK